MDVCLPELPGGAAVPLRWLVAPGAVVAAGAPLVIVRTTQVEAALPSPAAGRLAELLVAAGAGALEPGAALARLDIVGAAPEPAAPPAPLRASPTARQVALVHAIDLAALAGSGPDGRVLKRDVLAALGSPAPATAMRAVAPQPPLGLPALMPQPVVAGVPLATALVELDASAALATIAAHAPALARFGLEATLTTVVVQAVAALLPHSPLLNAAYSPAGIVRRRHVHLAVGTVVAGERRWAYVAHAGDLTLRGIARALRDAPPAGDATFTVVAVPHGHRYNPLPLLPGTGALLAVSAPDVRPTVLPGDRIALRPIATLTLTYDVRLLSFADAGCFLSALREAMGAGE
jgi:pyruvate/2-oxoglutarate dehydrogenase complex dihydrolipoamide acyltransferase (E2) component